MNPYVYRWANVSADVFHPAPEPDPGEERQPEMDGVERVISYDGAGTPRAVHYMVGVGAKRRGILDGDYVVKRTDGVFEGWDKVAFEDAYIPAPPPPKATVPASKVVQ